MVVGAEHCARPVSFRFVDAYHTDRAYAVVGGAIHDVVEQQPQRAGECVTPFTDTTRRVETRLDEGSDCGVRDAENGIEISPEHE